MTKYRDRNYNPSADELRSILFGRKIVKVTMGYEGEHDGWSYDHPQGSVTLDDGMVLFLAGNTGGCSCGAGDYELTRLNTVDNAITNVIVEERPDQDDRCEICDQWSCEHNGFYRIFVVAEDHNQHLLAQFDGSDGNGYYGTGYWISVQR